MSHSFTIFEGTATCTVLASRLAISVLRNQVRKLASEVPSSIWTSAFCHNSRFDIIDCIAYASKCAHYTCHESFVKSAEVFTPLLISCGLRGESVFPIDL